jgi:predicted outer membrane repeat protein
MRAFATLFFVLVLSTLACGSGNINTPAVSNSPTEEAAVTQTASDPASETATPPASDPTEEPVTPTATPSPANVIFVDTLEQEVYPFIENGKCSLAEAIMAANTARQFDSCNTGVLGESVIELMPGEYVFTQVDQSPPVYEWLISMTQVGTSLPPIISPTTIHGNGAVLTRDENAEPFRFFELMTNSTLTMNNITIQNGDVADDWGGAIYSMSASITLDNTHFINNRSDNGGAIYFTLGRIDITNSEFVNNKSTNSGGALYVDSSRSSIQSTRFEGNEADGEGGGLYAYFATIVIRDGFFIKNRITGNNNGLWGGGMFTNHVNITITESQFYQNESPGYAGAVGVVNPVLAGTDDETENMLEQVQDSPFVSDMFTSIPGFQATLEAHPSGIYVDFHEDIQIHNNCFANNVTLNPADPNWTSGIHANAAFADGNYWGHPSGPSGRGPGTGDSVGKNNVTFSPFLTEAPAFCDPTLSEIQ